MLSELASQEQALREAMLALGISTREAFIATREAPANRDTEFERIVAAYVDVHRRYATLAANGSRESLKRALFIQWYAANEPANLSAIARLDETVERSVLEELERAFVSGDVDFELRSMLGWYGRVGEHYFTYYNVGSRFPSIAEHLRASGHPLGSLAHSQVEWRNRGQMGNYWSSVLANVGHRS